MDDRVAVLRELRELLQRIRSTGSRALPVPELVSLRQRLGAVGVWVDFEAEDALGAPLVVLTVPPTPPGCFDTLTPREREVAELVATGLRNQDIALALGIRLGTVKDHVHRVLKKSGLDSRAAVAAVWRG